MYEQWWIGPFGFTLSEDYQRDGRLELVAREGSEGWHQFKRSYPGNTTLARAQRYSAKWALAKFARWAREAEKLLATAV